MEHFYKTVPGYFNYENVYDDIITYTPSNSPEKYVEIGAWKGKSICYAAVEIINSGKNITIDSVDTWEGSPGESVIMNDKSIKNNTLYNEFIKNIEPVKHIVTPVKMPSVEAAKLYEDKSLFFVFIDGSHLYESVKEDILAWLPKVKSGGFIGGHDIDQTEEFNGVRKAVDEIFPNKNDIEIFNVGWASWLHKVK
jgi:hypothetical protein